MPEGGVLNFAGDIRHRGKRWVHQDDGGDSARFEIVVNLRRIKAIDRKGRKEGREEVSPECPANSLRIRKPPEISARIAKRPVPAEGSSTTSSGRIAAADSAARPKRDRRGELLERLTSSERRGVWLGRGWKSSKALPAAPWAYRLDEDRAAILSQEQNSRGLAGIITSLPVPKAGGIGCAEGGTPWPREA